MGRSRSSHLIGQHLAIKRSSIPSAPFLPILPKNDSPTPSDLGYSSPTRPHDVLGLQHTSINSPLISSLGGNLQATLQNTLHNSLNSTLHNSLLSSSLSGNNPYNNNLFSNNNNNNPYSTNNNPYNENLYSNNNPYHPLNSLILAAQLQPKLSAHFNSHLPSLLTLSQTIALSKQLSQSQGIYEDIKHKTESSMFNDAKLYDEDRKCGEAKTYNGQSFDEARQIINVNVSHFHNKSLIEQGLVETDFTKFNKRKSDEFDHQKENIDHMYVSQPNASSQICSPPVDEDDEPGKLVIKEDDDSESTTRTNDASSFSPFNNNSASARSSPLGKECATNPLASLHEGSLERVLGAVNSSLTRKQFDQTVAGAYVSEAAGQHAPGLRSDGLSLCCPLCGVVSSTALQALHHRTQACPYINQVSSAPDLNNMSKIVSPRANGMHSFREDESGSESEHLNSADDRNEDVFSATDDGRKVRSRSHIRKEHLDILVPLYHSNPHPKKDDRERIARDLGFPVKVVSVWFQNTRARDRREQKLNGHHNFIEGGQKIDTDHDLSKGFVGSTDNNLNNNDIRILSPDSFNNRLVESNQNGIQQANISFKHHQEENRKYEVRVSDNLYRYNHIGDADNVVVSKSEEEHETINRRHYDLLNRVNLANTLSDNVNLSNTSSVCPSISSSLSNSSASTVLQRLALTYSNALNGYQNMESPEEEVKLSDLPLDLSKKTADKSPKCFQFSPSNSTSVGPIFSGTPSPPKTGNSFSFNIGGVGSESLSNEVMVRKAETPPYKTIVSPFKILSPTSDSSKRIITHEAQIPDSNTILALVTAARNSTNESAVTYSSDLPGENRLARILQKRGREEEPSVDKRRRLEEEVLGVYPCNQCDKSFNKQSSLARHKYEHSGKSIHSTLVDLKFT